MLPQDVRVLCRSHILPGAGTVSDCWLWPGTRPDSSVQQIVIVEGPDGAPSGSGSEVEHALGRRYLPFAFQLRLTSERQRGLSGSLPFIAAMKPVDGKTSVYVCRDRTCLAPATAIDDLEAALAS